MKKLFYSLFALVFAIAFTSCEDVPAPYFDPSGGGSDIITPLGEGTEIDPFNVAGANKYIADGNDGDATVYVRGIIVSITEIDVKQYGNATYTISDDGSPKNALLVYRGMALGNRKFVSEGEIKHGDEVIICGKIVNRNGENQFIQGNYIYYLNGESASGSGEISGSGTLDDPYTPGAANLFCKTLTPDVATDKEYYIKGKISRIANKGTYTDGGTFGNASFYISDSGEPTGEFYVYRILYLKNTKYNEYTGQKTDIKVGDEVIVCAKLVYYKGDTPETVAGQGYLYSQNGNTGEGGGGGGGTPSGDGTLNNPYNAAGAAQAVSGLTWTSNTDYQSTDNVYVKGKISRIASGGTYTEGGTYGNASFYISDDGTESGEFYCFRVLYLDNTKYNEYTGEKVDIKVGDEVVIYGKLMNYRGNTPETVSGQAYLYSLNSSGGGGGGGGSTFTRSADESTYVVFFTDNSTTASSRILTYDLTQCELTHEAENPSFTLSDASFAFSKGGGNTTPKYWKTGNFNEFRMYAKNVLTITPPSGKIHSIALQCSATYGSTNYMGNAQATATVTNGVITITNEWTSATSGTQLRIKQVQIQYAQ